MREVVGFRKSGHIYIYVRHSLGHGGLNTQHRQLGLATTCTSTGATYQERTVGGLPFIQRPPMPGQETAINVFGRRHLAVLNATRVSWGD